MAGWGDATTTPLRKRRPKTTTPPPARPDPTDLEAWVRASCAAQDVPLVITDPHVLRRVTRIATTTP